MGAESKPSPKTAAQASPRNSPKVTSKPSPKMMPVRVSPETISERLSALRHGQGTTGSPKAEAKRVPECDKVTGQADEKSRAAARAEVKKVKRKKTHTKK